MTSTMDARFVILGIAQDAGYPQIGCRASCCDAAWSDPELRRLPASAAIVIRSADGSWRRWLIDAPPPLADVLHRLDTEAPPPSGSRGPALEGIFLTHAHLGHVAGLLQLGKEAAGAAGIPVWVMPRLEEFLVNNAPWRDLIEGDHIRIQRLVGGTPVELDSGIALVPRPVPHRGEHSETVGFEVHAERGSALYLPDIDAWDRDHDPAALAKSFDRIFVDGSFLDEGELTGRDPGEVLHPTIRSTLGLVSDLRLEERERIRFIHLNHTNPLLDQRLALEDLKGTGTGVAHEGEWFALR